MAALSHVQPSFDYGPKKGKTSVADAVALAMGIPEAIVEMARAYQRHNHLKDFDDAMGLYKAAEDLLSHPEKQAAIGKLLYQAEQASKKEEEEEERMQTKEFCTKEKLQTDGAVGTGKSVVRAAEIQEKTLITKTDDAKPDDDKGELKAKVQRLARENHRLRQRKMCRKCKEVDLSTSGVTYLPCGHFITCESCSETFEDCPACGKSIMGTVRTFLS